MGQWPICIYKARSNHQNAKGLLILYSLPYHCLIYFPISPLTAITIIIWSPTSYHHIIIKSSPSSYDYHHHDHDHEHDHDHQIITIIIWSPSSYDHQHHMITSIILSPLSSSSLPLSYADLLGGSLLEETKELSPNISLMLFLIFGNLTGWQNYYLFLNILFVSSVGLLTKALW